MGTMWKYICVSAIVALMSAAGLSAQETTASLRGAVLDPSGARVPSAKVTAIQEETGFTRTGVSDARG